MSASNPIYFINGRYVPAHRAVVSVRDLGFTRAFALFEALRTYNRVPFLLGEHLRRLQHGARAVGLRCPHSHAKIRPIMETLIRRNGPGELLLRVILTGGESRRMVPDAAPGFAVLADPFHAFPMRQYQKGVALMTIPADRMHPELKSTVYFSAVQGTMQALRRGFDEAVYARANGDLMEGTTFNLVAVLPGPRLVIPGEGTLPGVTQDCILQIARRLRIPVARRPITPRMLAACREMFITSSNREVIPVARVNRHRLGAPGEWTRRIHAEYQKRITLRTGWRLKAP